MFRDKRGKEQTSDTETLAKKNEAKIEQLRSRINITSPNSIPPALLQIENKWDKLTIEQNVDRGVVRERSPVTLTTNSREKRCEVVIFMSYSRTSLIRTPGDRQMCTPYPGFVITNIICIERL